MLAFGEIFYVIGILLCTLAIAMIIPGALDFWLHDYNWQVFAVSSSITGFVGILLFFTNRPSARFDLSVREAFLMTSLSWISASIFASLPFIISSATWSTVDGVFEAISALTTTGATALPSVDYVPRGILLWRAILQWLGGIGIIMMAITILPILRIGGMQLFRAEFSDRSDKILPRASQMASAIFTTYFIISILCASMLYVAGMTGFDAVCYAMSTVSTGGLSTTKESIAAYNSPLIEIILMVFMIIGASSLILFYKALRGDWRNLWHDSQIRAFLLLIFCSIFLLVGWEYIENNEDLLLTLRYASFNVVSIASSTGYVTENYHAWGYFPAALFFLLTFVGGCTGSTAGGIKIFRFQVMLAVAKAQLHQLRRPHGVFLPRYNNKPIAENIFTSVFTFFALYGISFSGLALGLAWCELDILTALSCASGVLGNGGISFGTIMESGGNYSLLPDGAKCLLMFGMLLGRLELVTLFILFSRAFWKN